MHVSIKFAYVTNIYVTCYYVLAMYYVIHECIMKASWRALRKKKKSKVRSFLYLSDNVVCRYVAEYFIWEKAGKTTQILHLCFFSSWTTSMCFFLKGAFITSYEVTFWTFEYFDWFLSLMNRFNMLF